MNKMFIGLLFVFINIKINGISITPAFVGYILIYLGMNEWPEVGAFQKYRQWCIAATLLGAIVWLPIFPLGPLLNILFTVLSTALQCWITYVLVLGMEELEGTLSVPLNAEPLRNRWTLMAISLVCCLVFTWLSFAFAMIIALILGFLCAILYVVTFYQGKKLIEQVHNL